jgi:rhodanese-related sulfurtransferase
MQEFVEFAFRHGLLFVALIVILGALIGGEILGRIRGVKNISPTQALQLINHDDALVLDIRDSGEYKSAHIPNARHIPLKELENRLGELAKFKDKPVILYCRAGVSSSGAGGTLTKNGFKMVHTLSGGLPAWQNANLPVSKK